MQAYLGDDLWLRLAQHANRMAARLGAGFAGTAGVHLWSPVQANEVFVSFPGDVAARLFERGGSFHPWQVPGDPAAGRMCRLVTSFRTREDDVDRCVALAQELCAG